MTAARRGPTPSAAVRSRLTALIVAGSVLLAAGCADDGAGTWSTQSPSPGASGAAAGSGPSVGAVPASPASLRYAFPVAGKASYAHAHHDYPATDIMAACGSQVRAVTSGVILETVPVDRWDRKINDGATRGGLSVSLLGDDGVRYYGSHLRSITPGIAAGARVEAGQELGIVGDTGDASACHLHFGISPTCARTGDWWVRRGVLWPWRYLDAWRAGTALSPAGEANGWQAAHGCPDTAPPGA